jgi:spore germination cell wall hydrolase CwlJ-like protein
MGRPPMKNKYIYINALLLIVLICIFIEIRHQTDLQRIDALTAENAALQQNIADMQSTIDKLLQNMQQLTKENEQLKAQQTKPPETQKISRSADRPRYNLTDAERDLVERVVMAESGGESYKGQMLVAQCILNACEIDGIRPAKVIKKYVYAKARPEPSDSVKRAVSAVFDKGDTVTDEPIVYFYAPKIVKSEFHESQRFVLAEGNHKFFAERKE